MTEQESDFKSIDELTQEQQFIDCYQMQLDDKNICNHVYLGKYLEIPLPVHKIINFNNHKLHVVSYILSDDDIKNKIYKIVGVNVFEKDKTDSLCSIDLVKHPDNNSYQILYCDHVNKTVHEVENIETFPDKDKVLEYIITKAFEEPVKSILLK